MAQCPSHLERSQCGHCSSFQAQNLGSDRCDIPFAGEHEVDQVLAPKLWMRAWFQSNHSTLVHPSSARRAAVNAGRKLRGIRRLKTARSVVFGDGDLLGAVLEPVAVAL